MINSLWIAKSGMSAQQTQMDVVSHNLANVSTTGYKRASAVFQDLIYQNQRQVGASTSEQSQLPTGLHLGLGVNVVSTSRDFRQGTPQASGTLEGSNVNAVECMVGMIAASRQFEQQMRLLQTAETNDKTASQLLGMNG